MSRNTLILAACVLFGATVVSGSALASEPAPTGGTESAGKAPGQASAGPTMVQAPTPSTPGRAASSPRKGKGSGFWTSDVPADGNKYRYGMMAVGAGIAAMMGLFVLWLIRRHSPAHSRE